METPEQEVVVQIARQNRVVLLPWTMKFSYLFWTLYAYVSAYTITNRLSLRQMLRVLNNVNSTVKLHCYIFLNKFFDNYSPYRNGHFDDRSVTSSFECATNSAFHGAREKGDHFPENLINVASRGCQFTGMHSTASLAGHFRPKDDRFTRFVGCAYSITWPSKSRHNPRPFDTRVTITLGGSCSRLQLDPTPYVDRTFRHLPSDSEYVTRLLLI